MMTNQAVPQEIVFYSGGFFGYGPEGDFAQWSLAHFAPILVTIVAIVATWVFRKPLRTWRHEENARFLYGFAMFIIGMSYYWRLLYVGVGPDVSNTLMDRLPIQVCEWTLVVCLFMMLKKSPLLFDMTFFLTLSFSLLPLLFPAVISRTGPTYYRYYQFWLEHLMPIYGMFYMMFVHQMEPHPRGILAAFVLLALLSIPSAYLNQAFEEANYLYMKPGDYSMISFLPKTLPVLAALYISAVLALMGVDRLVWKLVTGRRRVAKG